MQIKPPIPSIPNFQHNNVHGKITTSNSLVEFMKYNNDFEGLQTSLKNAILTQMVKMTIH